MNIIKYGNNTHVENYIRHNIDRKYLSKYLYKIAFYEMMKKHERFYRKLIIRDKLGIEKK